jgi:hypothetical protein
MAEPAVIGMQKNWLEEGQREGAGETRDTNLDPLEEHHVVRQKTNQDGFPTNFVSGPPRNIQCGTLPEKVLARSILNSSPHLSEEANKSLFGPCYGVHGHNYAGECPVASHFQSR